MTKCFLNKEFIFGKRSILAYLFIIFPIFFFAEELSAGVLSIQDCRENLVKFYKGEQGIDFVHLATSTEKLESIILSLLENKQSDFLQETFTLYLEHAYVISSIYDMGGMKEYSQLIEKIQTNVNVFMQAIKPDARIYLKYADFLYLSLAYGSKKAVHALPILYRKVLMLDKDNKEALIKLASWYISPADERTSNFNGFIENAEKFMDELEEVDLFNACLWYSIYYMKNYNPKKGFEYLQKANKIFPHHVLVAHLWNNYKNGIFKM